MKMLTHSRHILKNFIHEIDTCLIKFGSNFKFSATLVFYFTSAKVFGG